MIGKLVVVKNPFWECVGVITGEGKDLATIELLSFRKSALNITPLGIEIHIFKNDIIKKSSRPVKMKQQLSLEEQQPTTL